MIFAFMCNIKKNKIVKEKNKKSTRLNKVINYKNINEIKNLNENKNEIYEDIFTFLDSK